MAYAIHALMSWNGHDISDHGRSSLTVTPEQLENAQRMADGTMRKYYVNTKRTFACSWERLPRADANTWDGKYGGDNILAFYNSTKGAFTLVLTHGDTAVTETYTVMFTSFSQEIVSRGPTEMWSISVEMTEV